MIDPTQHRLGRAPHDPLRVASIQPHVMAAVMVPEALDRSAIPFQPGAYQNDQGLPDCTAAAMANCARAFSWTKAATDIVVDPDKVTAFYAKCAGVPHTFEAMAATDGAIMLEVMLRAEREGVDVGQQVPLVPTFTRCSNLKRLDLANAAVVYGASSIGVNLSISDQNMQIWDTDTPIGAGDPTPGTWGGHNTFIWDWEGLRDQSLVRIGTWGNWKQATWRWVESRIDEAYALHWSQL